MLCVIPTMDRHPYWALRLWNHSLRRHSFYNHEPNKLLFFINCPILVFNYTGTFLISVQFVTIVYFAWFYSLAWHVIFVCMSWLKCFRYQFYVSGSVPLANILWSLKSISLPTFFIQWIKYQETPVPLSFSDTYTNTHNRGQGEENDSSVSFYH